MSAPSVADATLILAHAQLSTAEYLSIKDFDAEDDVLSMEATYTRDGLGVTDTINLEVDVLDQCSATLNLYSETQDESIIEHPVTKAEAAPYFPVDASVLMCVIEKHLHDLYARTHASLAERLVANSKVIDFIDEKTVRIDVEPGFYMLGSLTEVGLDVVGPDGARHTLVDVSATVHEDVIDDELLCTHIVEAIDGVIAALTSARPLLALVRADAGAAPVAPALPATAPVSNPMVDEGTWMPEATIVEQLAPWEDAPAESVAPTTNPEATALGEGWMVGPDGGYIFTGTFDSPAETMPQWAR